MSGFDWRGLLERGRALGLRPHEVWALTPAEFRLIAGERDPGAVTRARLDELSALYPD